MPQHQQQHQQHQQHQQQQQQQQQHQHQNQQHMHEHAGIKIAKEESAREVRTYVAGYNPATTDFGSADPLTALRSNIEDPSTYVNVV